MENIITIINDNNIKDFYIININNHVNSHNNIINKNLFNLVVKNNCFFLNILNNATFINPIYLINDNRNNIGNITKIIINVEQNSNAILIDHKYNQNIITEINLAANAALDYYLIQHQDKSKLEISQNDNSSLNAKLLANSMTNNQLEIIINLLQNKANSTLSILQQTTCNFINTINLWINHYAPNCSSITNSRALAMETSSILLNGTIIVNKNANKTHANLQNKNLMLSKLASITACPELIINNKDVICNHGSSTGNLDKNALFYMQTRGLNITDATKILVAAFLKPIIKEIKYKEIINYLQLADYSF